MSRIGRHPIAIPAGVTVTVSDDNHISREGARRASWSRRSTRTSPSRLRATRCTSPARNDEKQNRAFHGLYRALIANMVTGVTEGYKKTLALVGTGYRAEAKGDTLNITIGYSHPVIMKAPQNIAFATPNQTTIEVSGIDKQQVGNIAADIRAVRSPEPYHGKGHPLCG